MNQFSKEEIYQEIGKIISKFNNLECDLCAREIQKFLNLNQIKNKILKLKTKRANDFFIISNRFSVNESITYNGIHYGVEVQGLVFDNLSTQGMTRKQWEKDFSCRSGSFIIDELEYI